MMTHRHERTTCPDRRNELIELIASGTTAYPGSEMGYLIDMLLCDREESTVRPASRSAWSLREMFHIGAVLRLT